MFITLLFDLFSESIPFGLRIQRFYQNPANPSSSPRNHFNLFLEKTLSNCFADLIQTFPVSIYLIGHTIYTWHHRHIELLDRLQLHCQHIFNSPFSNFFLAFQWIQVAIIITSTEEVMSSLYHFNLIVSIAYAINQDLSITTSSFLMCVNNFYPNILTINLFFLEFMILVLMASLSLFQVLFLRALIPMTV